MSAALYREGDELNSLLAALASEHGGPVRVTDVTYPRTGGVFGFFARQRVAVRYELPTPTPTPAPDPTVLTDNGEVRQGAAAARDNEMTGADNPWDVLISVHERGDRDATNGTGAAHAVQDAAASSGAFGHLLQVEAANHQTEASASVGTPVRTQPASRSASTTSRSGSAGGNGSPYHRTRKRPRVDVTANNRLSKYASAAATTTVDASKDTVQATVKATPKTGTAQLSTTAEDLHGPDATARQAPRPVRDSTGTARAQQPAAGPQLPPDRVVSDLDEPVTPTAPRSVRTVPLPDFTGKPIARVLSAVTTGYTSERRVDAHTPDKDAVPTPQHADASPSLASETLPVSSDSDTATARTRRLFTRIGIPDNLLPASATHRYQIIETLVENLPSTPQLPSSPGTVIVLVGPSDALRTAYRQVAAQLRPTRVWVVGHGTDQLAGDAEPVTVTDAFDAAAHVAEHRLAADGAGLALVSTDVHLHSLTGSNTSSVEQIAQAFTPDAVWGCADARWKAEDVHKTLGGHAPRALMVTGMAQTSRPGTVLTLGLPIASCDGIPATHTFWTALLLDRTCNGQE